MSHIRQCLIWLVHEGRRNARLRSQSAKATHASRTGDSRTGNCARASGVAGDRGNWRCPKSFSWAGVARCSSSPPAFTLSGVPAGTTRLAFNMIDLNAPSYPHGGGTIAYQGGNQIAAGTFSYKGPCPPENQRHNYRWTVRALDAGGNTLATTSAASPFPPR